MSKERRARLVIAAAALAAPGAALAHHGDAGRYEEALTTVTGTVVEFNFVNPHSTIVFEVEGSNGHLAEWHGELTAPGLLTRRWGWSRETLKAGDTITVTGRRRKNGERYMTLTEGASVLDGSGREIYRGAYELDVLVEDGGDTRNRR